ncbi:hypothetical protein Tco_1389529 [Tanacetum coccineum]
MKLLEVLEVLKVLEVFEVLEVLEVLKVLKEAMCVCHWADPFKDLKWSNVPGIKLSLLFESNDTFLSQGDTFNIWTSPTSAQQTDNSTSGKCLSHPFPKSITQARSMPSSVWMALHFVHQSGDDMPYSCVIEYPKHSALTARIWM